MLSRFLLAVTLWVCGGVGFGAQEPFTVSLWSSAANLSRHYRATVRAATDRYRGDGRESIVLLRVHYFTLSSGAVVRVEEARFDSDPFPAEPFELRADSQDGNEGI